MNNLRVAYILSMKGGLAAWNYREIDILSNNGVEIWAYPTKWEEGKYMPNPDWHFRVPNAVRALFAQPQAFMSNPGKYCRLLSLAIRMHTVPEFLMAMDNCLDMHERGIEHIHCHFGDRKLFTGYFCSRWLDLPLTVTVHAYEILCNPNPGMFKLAASHCARIITVSEFNKREISRVFGVPQDSIEVVHVHGDMSDERMRTSTKILIVGEFREKKGHDVLFKALKKLNRDDLTLWVVGEGSLDVRSMAEEIGVSHQTVFLGRLGKDVLNILYDACDFFVLPSRTASNGDREGVPVVIMEAMSHRKAVISTNHVGIPELVPQIIVEENDVDGLAEAIAYLANNPQVRTDMGERNYGIVKKDYSDDEVLRLKAIFHADTLSGKTADL